MRPADRLQQVVDRLGRSEALEKPAAKAADQIRPLVASTPVKNALSGTWLGHKLHPMLTDVVIGSWMSAGVLDLLGGRQARDSADLLVATGVVAAVPTAAAGLSDYTDLYGHGRRVAFVHAIATDTAVVLQVASLAARRGGRRVQGVGLSMAALGVTAAAGWLGGHLSYVLGIGVDHTAFDEGPEDWVTVAPAASIGAEPTVVTAGEHEVLVTRVDGGLSAMANRCSHAGWPIADGPVDDGCITCPYHGSVFRLSDGAVVRGPAATGQLRYEVRERSGQIQVRGTR